MVRILILVILHLFGDFFLQSLKLNKLKASKLPYLVKHVGIYTLVFIVLSPLLIGFTFLQGLVYSLINGVVHLFVDFFTIKLKNEYREKSEIIYIAVIAFDAVLHILILVTTLILLYPDVFNAPYLFG